MIFAPILNLIILLGAVSVPQHSLASEFVFLNPQEVDELTNEIQSTLARENCRIPKWKYEFGGVTFGEFAVKGQTDVAVICVREDVSVIRVFWGGSVTCPDEINSLGQFVSTVGEKYIWEHYNAHGGQLPPDITHEAVNDHYVEKSSFVKYCENGEWIELTGAD